MKVYVKSFILIKKRPNYCSAVVLLVFELSVNFEPTLLLDIAACLCAHMFVPITKKILILKSSDIMFYARHHRS